MMNDDDDDDDDDWNFVLLPRIINKLSYEKLLFLFPLISNKQGFKIVNGENDVFISLRWV